MSLYAESSMETIHDFPGYGFCSGLGSKGYKLCLSCDNALRFTCCKSLKKTVYLRHKRFLQDDHPLQMRDRMLINLIAK